MPTFEAVRGWATAVFLFSLLAIVSALISANVRTFASKRGLDTYLDRWADNPYVVAAIKWCQRVLAGIAPLERRWWLWLALGLSGGAMITLWTVPASEVREETPTQNTILNAGADPARSSVLLPSRFYSAKNKEEVAAFLDKISDILNKPGEDIFQLAQRALGGYEWSRPEAAPSYVRALDDIEAKSAQMDAVLYDDLLAHERDYRQEMNAILFPKDPLVKFRNAVRGYRSGLSALIKLRNNFQDDEGRNDFQQVVRTSQSAFVAARDELLTWVTQRQELIRQTRNGLRS